MKKFKKLCGAILIAGFMLTQIALGSSGEAEAASGKWKQDKKGWWYSYSDGSYAKSQWLQIGKKWYYFNANGYMAKGWKQIGKKWYYFGTNGAMRTGWQKISGKWYYFLSSGSMVTGTKKIKGTEYHFDSKGVCQNPTGKAIVKAPFEQKYWIIFREGYRDSRLEASTIDSTLPENQLAFVWDRNVVINNASGSQKCNQYHLDGNQFVYDRNYGILTDYATEVIASNLDVVDAEGNIIIPKCTYEEALRRLGIK